MTGTGDRHVVVVGAGITGLTTAFTLATREPGLRVTVLEASHRVGGKILTTPFAGRPVDCGADAFLARVPEARELCEELGIAGMLTSPAERSALVWARGELRRLPAGLVLGVPTDMDALAASGIVSAEGVARAAADLDATEPPADEPTGDPEGDGDLSVGHLVRGRLGDEVYEQLVAPLLSGVNAGDADQLSVAAGAAQLAAAARRRPSLILGLREQQQAALDAGADPSAPVFHGIPVGTQTLTDLLLARLTGAGTPVHLSCPVESLERNGGGGYVLRTPQGRIEADRVVLCTPAPVAARLLAGLAPTAAEGLADLEYASAAMVTLAVRRVGPRPPARRQRLPRRGGRPAPHDVGLLVGVGQVGPPRRPRRGGAAGLGRPLRRHRPAGAHRPGPRRRPGDRPRHHDGAHRGADRVPGDPLVGRPAPVPTGPPGPGPRRGAPRSTSRPQAWCWPVPPTTASACRRACARAVTPPPPPPPERAERAPSPPRPLWLTWSGHA